MKFRFLFESQLSKLAGGALMLVCVCGCQVYNSSSGDVMAFSDGATAVLQNKCSQCHNYATMTAAQLEAQGLIVPGAPMSSLLYTNIKGSGVAGASMPPSGATAGDVTTEELELIKTWIQTL